MSTQVGCKYKCPFCASGQKGLVRNLSVSEMVDQVLSVQKNAKIRITNIVFMGMGEPLDNYENLEKAIQIINHPDGVGVGARKITVSTCGIIPGILKLKDLGVQVELSVSLHATDDELRNELVPANRKYPINELIAACQEFYNETNRVVTIEYTVISGKNNSVRDAKRLADIVRRINGKVNLIACNPYGTEEKNAPDHRAVELFRGLLIAEGVKVTVRHSKGEDIMAACGQLSQTLDIRRQTSDLQGAE